MIFRIGDKIVFPSRRASNLTYIASIGKERNTHVVWNSFGRFDILGTHELFNTIAEERVPLSTMLLYIQGFQKQYMNIEFILCNGVSYTSPDIPRMPWKEHP